MRKGIEYRIMYFFNHFYKNFSPLLLCKINLFDILTYREVLTFRSNRTFGWERMWQASLRICMPNFILKFVRW